MPEATEPAHAEAMIATPDQLITAHIRWMVAGGFSDNTVEDAERLLRAAHRDLPEGLANAVPDELADFLGAKKPQRDSRKPDQRWSSQTKSTYRQHLRRFYQWCLTEERLTWDPSTTLRRPKVEPGVPHPASDAAADIAVTVLPLPYLLHTRLARFQGFRCIEVARLRREHITAAETRVHGKGDRHEVVPTHPRVWEIVEAMPPGPVTHRPDGKPVTAHWVSCSTAYRMLRAGAPITMHDLRAWFATWLLETTDNMELTRLLMRHRSMSTTQIYTKVRPAKLRDAVLGLPDITDR